MPERLIRRPEGLDYEVNGWYGEDGGPPAKTFWTQGEGEALATAQAWDEYEGCTVRAYRHDEDGEERIYPRMEVAS